MSRGNPHSSPAIAALASLAMAVLAGIAMAAPAAAAAPCGDSITVTRGDTLGGIARRCDSSVAALLQANPQIGDPRRLQLGWTLRLSGRDGQIRTEPAPAHAAADDRKRPDAHRAVPGQTVTGRPANRDGLTADGYRPPRRTVQSISIEPHKGAVGSAVLVNATGLPPGAVQIGVGFPGADIQQLAIAEVTVGGSIDSAVRVPDWAGPGDDLVFTLLAGNGEALTSGRFLVTGTGGPMQGWRLPEGLLTVGGLLRQGRDCILLETAHGQLYGLVSASWSFTPGVQVTLTGRPAADMPCGEGRGTIEVLALRNAAGGN